MKQLKILFHVLYILLRRRGGATVSVLSCGNVLRCRSYGRGFKSRREPVIELWFDQIKRLGQHMNFMCAVLGKPFMPTYIYEKDWPTTCIHLIGLESWWHNNPIVSPGPAFGQKTHHHHRQK